MKCMSKRFQTFLSGGLVLFFSFVAITHAGAQTCVQPPSGMTGWWPGDGNTDDIVGGRNAVLKDNATFGTGRVGQAFVLDGAGDYIDVPHDVALNVGTGDFTVDLWVYFNTTTGEQLLVEKYSEDFTGTPPGWFLTKLGNNSLRFGTGLGPVVVNSPALGLPINTWIHFAARRSSGVGTIFVNGAQVATGSLAYNADSASSLKFGHRGSPTDNPPTPGSTDTRGFFLNGRIDEVELFVGSALTDQEILDIYNAGADGKCKVTTVQIDIKPGSDPNSINLCSGGAVPVAILGSATFDVNNINTDTLRFADAAVKIVGRRDPHSLCSYEDVNDDGIVDLVCHFVTTDIASLDGDSILANVVGELFDETSIKGMDSVNIVKDTCN